MFVEDKLLILFLLLGIWLCLYEEGIWFVCVELAFGSDLVEEAFNVCGTGTWLVCLEVCLIKLFDLIWRGIWFCACLSQHKSHVCFCSDRLDTEIRGCWLGFTFSVLYSWVDVSECFYARTYNQSRLTRLVMRNCLEVERTCVYIWVNDLNMAMHFLWLIKFQFMSVYFSRDTLLYDQCAWYCCLSNSLQCSLWVYALEPP